MKSYTSHYRSPLGNIALATDGTALTALWFEGREQASFPTSESRHTATDDLPIVTEVCRWLDIYFDGRVPDFTPPLLLHGSEFRLKVWHELLTIPYGHTLTYGSLARRIGCRSPQAVGGAVGHNPIALIVPCHRVVGAGGALTGYAAGLGRKAALLNMEADKQSICKEPIKRHRT